MVYKGRAVEAERTRRHKRSRGEGNAEFVDSAEGYATVEAEEFGAEYAMGYAVGYAAEAAVVEEEEVSLTSEAEGVVLAASEAATGDWGAFLHMARLEKWAEEEEEGAAAGSDVWESALGSVARQPQVNRQHWRDGGRRLLLRRILASPRAPEATIPVRRKRLHHPHRSGEVVSLRHIYHRKV